MTDRAESGAGHNNLIPTATVIGEARGEPYEGMFAVACVIRNRASSPRWWGGPSWESVCLSPLQFSCWNTPQNGGQMFLRTLSWKEIKNDYPYCLEAVRDCRSGRTDNTGGATHYVVTSWLHNPALRPAWADKLTPTVVIGNHSFFKET